MQHRTLSPRCECRYNYARDGFVAATAVLACSLLLAYTAMPTFCSQPISGSILCGGTQASRPPTPAVWELEQGRLPEVACVSLPGTRGTPRAPCDCTRIWE